MNQYYKSLYQKYRQKGILIDTNILLLWVVGTANPDRIEKFKRTEKFKVKDYHLLLQIFADCSKVVTTPHILTEVSNLAGQLQDPDKTQAFLAIAKATEKLCEEYQTSDRITKGDGFTKFGLTDCAITELARNSYLVLTDDLRLAHYLENSQQIDTINFNHIRGFLK